MYFSPYKVKNNTRTMQSTFYGLNKNARIGDGEFADMLNMSGDHAPLLSPRAPRVIAQTAPTKTVTETVTTIEVDDEGNETEVETTVTKEVKYNLNGILGDVGFAAVWGNDFYYMGNKVEGITLSDTPKSLLAMGAYVLIYPDTVYYNTETGEYGHMETGTTETGTLKSSVWTLEDGSVNANDSTAKIPVKYNYSGSYISGTTNVYFKPSFASISEGALLSIKIEGVAAADKRYQTMHVRINNGVIQYLYSMDMTYSSGGGKSDSTGKRIPVKVRISNLVWKTLPVASVALTEAIPIANATNLWYSGEHIKISGTTIKLPEVGNLGKIFSAVSGSGTTGAYSAPELSLGYEWKHKNLPALDYVCVHDNRLWGCRYGYQSTNDTTVNEIYCSKLGDFKVWTASSETATLAGDPYTMSVGEYGAFTGCSSHRGQLLFFKDNIVYRVSGDKPSNFQIDKISESGLQSGCEKSLEIIDEVLYYKSRNGVFAYDGSIPQKISDALGNFYYTDAVAGKHFSKYYITMVHDGVRKLYVYDTRTGLWHAEDDVDVRFFTEYKGALYGAIDNDVVCLSGTPAGIFGSTEAESAVKWSVETGDIGLGSPYQKFLRRLLIRMDMDDGAKVLVELLGDDGEWYTATKYMSPHKRSFLMPVVTPRVDHARIRISGIGGVKIYSISYETESAGDRYVESWSQQESAGARKAYSDERAMTRDEFWEEE